jgi:two-component system, sensor histidine kinase RegB
MPNLSILDLGRRLRIATLTRLRWLAVAGQSVAVVVTHDILGFPMPFGLCFAAIGVSALLNVVLRLHYPLTLRLDDAPATLLLAYDVLQLSVLLYLTGGLENPFAVLFLAPVMISAASLAPRWTAPLVLLMIAAASFLAFEHLPLPWQRDEALNMPIVYVAGIWVSLVLGATFIGIYAARVANEARQLSAALAATELVLAHEQHLSQLDGLAAAAAHELATPLATVTLVVKELARQLASDSAIADDIALISQELNRCRNILKKLTSLGNEKDGPFEEMSLSHLLEEVIEPHRHFGVEVTATFSGQRPEPKCRRNPGVLYGLGNLVENAVDFARSRVRITAGWEIDLISIAIEDDGPGFSPDVLDRIGEPYVTTRGPDRRAKSEEGAGLGLGLFIAKTLLERSGAALVFGNQAQTGARVLVHWPRAMFERGLVSPGDERANPSNTAENR